MESVIRVVGTPARMSPSGETCALQQRARLRGDGPHNSALAVSFNDHADRSTSRRRRNHARIAVREHGCSLRYERGPQTTNGAGGVDLVLMDEARLMQQRSP
jgi:hypothetical protein